MTAMAARLSAIVQATRPLTVILRVLSLAVLVALLAILGWLVLQVADPTVKAWSNADKVLPGLPLTLTLVGVFVASSALFIVAYGEPYLAALWITSARLPGLVAAAWLLSAIAQTDPAWPVT